MSEGRLDLTNADSGRVAELKNGIGIRKHFENMRCYQVLMRGRATVRPLETEGGTSGVNA